MQINRWDRQMRNVAEFWILCVTVMFSLGVTAQTITIPDPNFKAFLVANYDTSGDGEIQVSEAEAVTGTMDTPGEYGSPGNITDLTGIEYFINLTGLDCSYEPLTTLDVSANTALTYFKCKNNQLTALDVSANTALTHLDCSSNQLTALDVSANTGLTYLDCYLNQLTALDVRANTALTHLHCGYNPLTALDVSVNTALVELYCAYNQLTTLDVSANTALQTLYCDQNQLTALNVSANTALSYFVCAFNQLNALDVSANRALTHLYCDNNQLTALDVSANTALLYLDCSNNQLPTLDVDTNTALTVLNCEQNQLVDIPDVTGCASLTSYQCQGNYFNADDCATIAAIEAMGLSTFTYNPQADGYTLDCSGGTTTYTITCTAGTGGSTNPSGNQEVYDGSSQIVHIIPDAGYIVQDVLVDGSSVGPVTSYIFSNITADHTIEATFTGQAFLYNIPHLAGTNWDSSIIAYNPTDAPITLYLNKWDSDGVPEIQEMAFSVGSKKTLVMNQGILGYQGIAQVISESPDLSVKLTYQYLGSESLCEFFIPRDLAGEHWLIPNSIQDWFDWFGLAVANHHDTVVHVTFDAYKDGALVATTTQAIQPHTKTVAVSSGMWPGVDYRDVDMVVITSDQPIAAPLSITGNSAQDRHVFFLGQPFGQ